METLVKLLFLIGIVIFGVYLVLEGDNAGAKFIGLFFIVMMGGAAIIVVTMALKGESSGWPSSDSDE